MSQQFDNTNRGVLFLNNKKQKDTHPDRTGSINVDGVEYFLDGWLKNGQNGQFLSLSIKRKDKQADSAPQQSARIPQRPGAAAARGHGNQAPDFDDQDSCPF